MLLKEPAKTRPSRRRHTSVVNVRIDSEDKACADVVMARLGMTPTEVIRLLYRQMALQRRLPFEVALPPETIAAIEAVERGEVYDFNIDTYMQEAMDEIKAEDAKIKTNRTV